MPVYHSPCRMKKRRMSLQKFSQTMFTQYTFIQYFSEVSLFYAITIDKIYVFEYFLVHFEIFDRISFHFSMGWQLSGTGHGHSHGGSAAPSGHGHSENMNVRAAFIHVLGDVLQSIGVFCAAIIIYFNPTWQLADPICTFIFSIIVLWTTVTILKDAILVSTIHSVFFFYLCVNYTTSYSIWFQTTQSVMYGEC